MTDAFPHMTFPNETADYRTARNALLKAEMELRRQTETVAALRRALPPGGAPPEDFRFERIDANCRPEIVRLSELFGDSPTIMIYSLMYGPERDTPCPGCTHLLDAIDGAAPHLARRVPFYVAARSPIARLSAWARARGWRNLEMLAIVGEGYNAGYYGNTIALTPDMRAARGLDDDKNWDEPMLNVFQKQGDDIRHFWGSEMVFAPDEPGQDHRALDFADPLWGLLDMSPEGRGDTFFPKIDYN